jgi:hypothetical protein
MIDFSKFKLRTILIAAAVAIIWSIGITQYAPEIEKLNFAYQFALTTFIFYLIPSYLLGSLNNNTIKRTTGFFAFIAATDLLIPALAVDFNGVINTSTLLSGGAIDVFLANLYQIAGVTGFPLFVLVYPITFLALLVISALLLTDKQLHELVKNA